MQKAEPILWARLEVDTALAETLFLSRAAQLGAFVQGKEIAGGIAMGSVATLLFHAFENGFRGTEGTAAAIDGLVELPAVQDALRQESPLRRMWLSWRERATDLPPTFERLMKALRNGLTGEVREMARSLLLGGELSTDQKPYALLALAESADLADKAILRHALYDTEVIDSYFFEGVVSTAQVGDVALVALIRSSGRYPKDFGFDYVEVDGVALYYPSTLGFRSNDARKAASEKWIARTGTERGK